MLKLGKWFFAMLVVKLLPALFFFHLSQTTNSVSLYPDRFFFLCIRNFVRHRMTWFGLEHCHGGLLERRWRWSLWWKWVWDTDLLQFECDHGESSEDAVCGAGDGDDPLRTGSLWDVDPSAALWGQRSSHQHPNLTYWPATYCTLMNMLYLDRNYRKSLMVFQEGLCWITNLQWVISWWHVSGY